MKPPTDWAALRAAREARIAADPETPGGMAAANSDMVARVVAGMGPDSRAVSPEGGARAVANMASDHAPAFCNPTGPKAYLNAYDLPAPATVSATRQRVDAALPLPAGYTQQDIYFLALEVNGTGVRFYGDLCLVLKPQATAADVRILNGNSYDLVRLPLSTRTGTDTALRSEAARFWGVWREDLTSMATLKVFAARRSERRFTTGQVSDAILDDEDYLEVLRLGSFDASDLQEVRITAASAAAEADAAERMRHGPTPSAASLLWRRRRRDAVAAFEAAGVPVRVVSHSGRLKS
ncbi:hypothetical protein [Qipengyuania qiaonensis]|uniref:Uncharacterized protein n=1 Tax=Qipengyuania qiaonensis TaxID=2867240 RepID=A0ABS7J2X6_9SPHN|nr:hypothetical protein [Qipengyuania qiaonensis]MBX7481674.1 hypothetical protein [Qipengyuania qiaonensis]